MTSLQAVCYQMECPCPVSPWPVRPTDCGGPSSFLNLSPVPHLRPCPGATKHVTEDTRDTTSHRPTPWIVTEDSKRNNFRLKHLSLPDLMYAVTLAILPRCDHVCISRHAAQAQAQARRRVFSIIVIGKTAFPSDAGHTPGSGQKIHTERASTLPRLDVLCHWQAPRTHSSREKKQHRMRKSGRSVPGWADACAKRLREQDLINVQTQGAGRGRPESDKLRSVYFCYWTVHTTMGFLYFRPNSVV